ncbi:MAG: alanine--tRNA ligase [Exilispira sp.]|nr:alanine--tRNA ligase [Exilispira sp.]
MLSSNEIREKFLEFFKQKDHVIFESSPVVPYDDPTLLFTNAGMNQFKKIFLGEVKSDLKRAASAQKCIRVSGKHNDLEEVGKDGRHHTFFEMLGNWSFGDYYKKEAIIWGWEFLTTVMGLDKDKLYISVYKDDDESYNIWKDIIGVPENKIYRLGDIEKKDEENFWSMGETGPCGPCSEIYYDQGPGVGCGKPDCSITCGCDRYLELWNLVFMQYNRDLTGKLTPLPFKSVDTGMGLERITAVLQNVTSNYETDLFENIISKLTSITGYSFKEKQVPFQIICDHIRMITFAIADGALPSNEGRGFVVRRILRRAARQARHLDIKKPFLYLLVPSLVEKMGDYYKEIKLKQEQIMQIIKNEEEKFNRTLDKGLGLFYDKLEIIKKENKNVLPAEDVFVLHDTYGFPLDLTRMICEEEGISCDEEGFERLMEKQREQSRTKKVQFDFSTIDQDGWHILRKGESIFTGYTDKPDKLAIRSSILSYSFNDEVLAIFFDKTPFYAESGGQVADEGLILGFNKEDFEILQNRFNLEKKYPEINEIDQLKTYAKVILKVENVYKTMKGPLHLAAVEDGKDIVLDENVMNSLIFFLIVDIDKRYSTMRNHTATHLLHQALIEVLGSHVEQAGSFVCSSYLRFDFPHPAPLTDEQINLIESRVNSIIFKNLPVIVYDGLTLKEAKAMNAKALFTEKYGDRVRVIKIPDFSIELCGGTHSPTTGFIGGFSITAESSVSAGTRRVEAVTGSNIIDRVNNFKNILKKTSYLAGTKSFEQIPSFVEKMLEENEIMKKELQKLRINLADSNFKKLLNHKITKNGIDYYLLDLENENIDNLKRYADRFKAEEVGCIIIVNRSSNSVMALSSVSRDLTNKVSAKLLLQDILKVAGGSAGGREDFAQGGAKDYGALQKALKEFGF